MNLIELTIAAALGSLVMLMIFMSWESVTAIELQQAKINQTQENARFAFYVLSVVSRSPLPEGERGRERVYYKDFSIKHQTLYLNRTPLITPIKRFTLCKTKQFLKILLEFPKLKGLNAIWEKHIALNPNTPLNGVPDCK